MKAVLSILLCFSFFLQAVVTKTTANRKSECSFVASKKGVNVSHSCCYKMGKEKKEDNATKNCCKGFNFCMCGFQIVPPLVSFSIDFQQVAYSKTNFRYLESNSTYTFSFFQPPRFAS